MYSLPKHALALLPSLRLHGLFLVQPHLLESMPSHYPFSSGDILERALTTCLQPLKLFNGSSPKSSPRSFWSHQIWPFLLSTLILSLSCSLSVDPSQFEFQTLLTSGPLCTVFLRPVQCFLPLLLIIPSALISPKYPSGPGMKLRRPSLKPSRKDSYPTAPFTLCSTQ